VIGSPSETLILEGHTLKSEDHHMASTACVYTGPLSLSWKSEADIDIAIRCQSWCREASNSGNDETNTDWIDSVQDLSTNVRRTASPVSGAQDSANNETFSIQSQVKR